MTVQTIQEFITQLKEKHIVITSNGDDLKISGQKTALTNEIVDVIKSHKSEILDYFKNISYNTIPLAPLNEYYSLSHSQKRLWLIDQTTETKGLYNASVSATFSQVNIDALNNAFAALLLRHEILRTTFHVINGNPMQRVRDLQELDTIFDRQKIEANSYQDYMAFVNKALFYPLDLSSAPFKAYLIELTNDTSIVFLVLHHIVTDAWSNNIIYREFLDLYKHFNNQHPVNYSPLPIQYKDYAHWQNERLRLGYFDNSLKYWKNKLSGELPTLPLPFDYKRSDFGKREGASVAFELPASITNQLKIFGHNQQATLYMVVVSIIKSFLYRYTNLQADIILGSVITGREHFDLDDQVGFYANTIVLRSSLNDSDTFNSFLAKVRDNITEVYDHQYVPFDVLIEHLELSSDRSRNPLFDVMVNYNETSHLASYETIPEDTLKTDDEGVSKFDLSFSFVLQSNNTLIVDINYDKGLFKKEKIMLMAKHLKNLTTAIVQEPDLPIYQLSILSATERIQLLNTFNDTKVDSNFTESIKYLFERQVEINLHEPCIVSNEGAVTFNETNVKANQLAHYLVDHYHITQGSRVGIHMKSSVDRMITLISLIKIGAIYVPMELDYPNERKLHMIDDAGISVLLTDGPASGVPDQVATVAIHTIKDEVANCSSENIASKTSPEDIFTILYTSGSTGKPKGVLIHQKGLINRMRWLWKSYQFDIHDVIYQKTPFVFDVSIGELFMPLCFGAKLLIAESGSAEEVVSNVDKHKVTYIHFSPALLNKFLDAVENDDGTASLRFVFASGEALLKETVTRFYHKFNVPLINLYGPTEASIEASFYETKRDDSIIPIGKPIDNVRLYVVDRKIGLLPIGIPGEIVIAGIGVAEGYLNAPDKTMEKFIPDNFSPEAGQRMYKTGDVGCWNSKGEIEFLGRADNQISINGARIELGEIENALLENPKIKEAVVLVTADTFGNHHLIAHCTKKNSIHVGPEILPKENELTASKSKYQASLEYSNNNDETRFDGVTIDELFEKSVSNNPDSIALICGNRVLTYALLSEKINQLAHYLRNDHRVTVGDHVAVLMERSEKTVIALLAILKTGAAYIPLDVGYPDARIEFMVRNAEAKLILSDNANASRNFGDCAGINYEKIEEKFSVSTPSFQTAQRNPEDLCYICYTSGSTGTPKGVMIRHNSVVDYIKTFIGYFDVTSDDIVLHQASIAFDTSVEEIFPVLCSGGKLVIHPTGGHDIDKFINLINASKITLVTTTPLVINEINSRYEEITTWPRIIISGGDELKTGYIDNVIKKSKLYNTYGPTEATVCASFALIDDLNKCNVIGHALPGHEIYLLDEDLQQVDAGSMGEICIAGPGLARGYIKQEEETKRKFIRNPFGDGLIYRSGDMGRRNDDGFLEFCGRKDRQVKVRGYRVELSEIDHSISEYLPGIVSFTIVKNDDENNARIISYFKFHHTIDPKELRTYLMGRLPHFMIPDFLQKVDDLPMTINGKIDLAALPTPDALNMDYKFSTELRDFLRMKLPAFMVPSYIRTIEKMPLTITGKINRKALQELAVSISETQNYIAPVTETQRKIATIWERTLKRSNLGLGHNFFEAGGTSLKAMQIVSEVYKEFKRDISLKDIFNNPNIEDLAKLVEGHSVDKSLIIQLGSVKSGRQNIFFIPPIMGSTTIFKSLAGALKDFNVFGLQHRGFDADDGFCSSLEEMAFQFVHEIKRIEKGHHVSIVGYSMGAPVAFETAKLLQAMGLSTQLIFIDRGAIAGQKGHRQFDTKEAMDSILELELNQWLKFFEGKNIERVRKLLYNNIQILNNYSIGGNVNGPVLAIEAKSKMDTWSDYISGDFSLQRIEAEHYGILNVENIPIVARWISDFFSSVPQRKDVVPLNQY